MGGKRFLVLDILKIFVQYNIMSKYSKGFIQHHLSNIVLSSKGIGLFKNGAGFTLLEMLLVVAAIGILAGIVILAINPTKQLGDTRNAQRKSDVTTILNAIYQYSLDVSLPTLTTGACATSNTGAEICTTGGTCTGLTDLSVLTASAKYLVSIPIDPSETTANQTGYFVVKTADDRVTVCAPMAEQGATITVTR